MPWLSGDKPSVRSGVRGRLERLPRNLGLVGEKHGLDATRDRAYDTFDEFVPFVVGLNGRRQVRCLSGTDRSGLALDAVDRQRRGAVRAICEHESRATVLGGQGKVRGVGHASLLIGGRIVARHQNRGEALWLETAKRV